MPGKITTRESGHQAEQIALSVLQDHHFLILRQNYQCRFGEIDIIAKREQLIIFVEVRYRKSPAFGNAIESVTSKKQHKITITAEHFIQYQLDKDQQFDYRFDVIALSSLDITQAKPEWIKGAW